MEELYLRLESLDHCLGEEVVDHNVGDGLPLGHQPVQLKGDFALEESIYDVSL